MTIPKKLLEELKQLDRAQKLHILNMLADELAEQDWIYRAYAPDRGAEGARALQEALNAVAESERPTVS